MKKVFLLAAITSLLLVGCKPDKPVDPSETELGFSAASAAELAGIAPSIPRLMGVLPTSFSLDMPPIGDQKQQGSCVSWSTAYAVNSYFKHIQHNTDYSSLTNLCSPKYVYNKVVQGSCTGTTYPANFNVLIDKGACSLASMPYNDSECSQQPNSTQDQEAALQKFDRFELVDKNDLGNIKSLLYSGQPIFIAVMVDGNFDKLSTPPHIWTSKGGAVRGGHAIVVIGWDDSKGANGAFKVQNSWGTNWGDNGYFWIDYNFFPNAVYYEECYTAYPAPNDDPNPDIDNGLILHYTFENNTNDVSGNSNNGTLQGNPASYVTGRIGQALQFTGSANNCCDNLGTHVLMPSVLSNNMQEFTISLWVNEYSMSYYHGESYISFGDIYQNGTVGISHHLNDFYAAAMSLQYTVGAVVQQGSGSSTGYLDLVYDNAGNHNWVLYTLVFSNNTMSCYRNSDLLNVVPNQTLKIGNSKAGLGIHWFDLGAGGVSTRFNGLMDDVRIYNRALSHQEVQALYNQ